MNAQYEGEKEGEELAKGSKCPTIEIPFNPIRSRRDELSYT